MLDVYVTRDQSRVFVIDFNPFAPRTDPLLFSYPELHDLFLSASSASAPPSLETLTSPTPVSSTPAPPVSARGPDEPPPPPAAALVPELRVVTPSSNPAAQSAVPRYAHNRYPKDVVDMSEGQSVAEFAKEWMTRVGEAAGLAPGQGVEGGSDAAASKKKEKERVGR